ncbi:TonB-dependent receptor [Flavobacterium sp. SUN046]|uniref:TonB-dependent receptor n=1 Tax=Flavobacterium sp. SUN046 TaxID=3002440 RepID=UPI002DB966F8|nr:TonB-dependent receptor [Flavobacterium sp. SUN046]MEC4048353.1 TonB-dependent receptor [Flavobacterium sp. SUN046]
MASKHFNSYFIFILLLVSFSIQSQSIKGLSIKGSVFDDKTQQAIKGVIIKINNQITTTDNQGRFQFILKNEMNPITIEVSGAGYESKIAEYDTTKEVFVYLKKEAQTLEEVVIKGNSKSKAIRENPVAISLISAKAIEQSNESNLIDVLVKNAPGLNAVKTGPNISKPFIRGLGYNRVLTLFDGMREEGQQWGDEHGIEVDGYTIQRAEIIKGPSSLLYGSDALAGVVSLFPFIPKEIDGKLHTKVLSEYQTNNNLTGNSIRISYSTPHYFVAVSGSNKMAKNYRNAIDGRVYNTNFNETNCSVLFGYNSKKGHSHINFTLYDNQQGIPDGSRDSISRRFTKQVAEANFDDIKNRPLVTDEELNSYKLSPLHQRIQHYRLYTQNEYSIGKGKLAFLLGTQQNIRSEFNHPTYIGLAGMHVKLNTLNYSVRYTFKQNNHLESSFGFNGMSQNNQSIDATDFPIPNYRLNEKGANYICTWNKEPWHISGGIRYDQRHIQWDDFYISTNPINGFDQHSQIPTTNLQFPAFQKNYKGISSSIGASFQASERCSIKTNISRGYRAPNTTEIASNGLDPGAHIIYLGNRNFAPEFSLQEDIGINLQFKEGSVDCSLFNNHIQNYIYLSMLVNTNGVPLTDAQGNKTYQYQKSKAQLYGLECSGAYFPKALKGLRTDQSISLVYGFNRDSKYTNKGVQGEYLPLIPALKWVSSFSKQWELTSISKSFITAKLDWEYTAAQHRYLGLNNSETPTPDYLLVNTALLFESTNKKSQRIQFQFQINNLFNLSYQSNMSRLKYFEYYSHSPNGTLGMYNMGRNICFKVVVFRR